MKTKIAIIGLLALTACDDSDSKQRRAQEIILNQAVDAIGMPAITNFAEKRMLKQILELRDKPTETITYIVDLNGKLHKVCDSFGYGIPYATQFTSPMKGGSGSIALPQADPNGLFSPSSADGTWINCTNPVTKKAQVVYIEPRVIVSPFSLVVE